jgi:hypothetical protein
MANDDKLIALERAGWEALTGIAGARPWRRFESSDLCVLHTQTRIDL